MGQKCTGSRYPVNPDAPNEGIDIHHDAPCPVHPDQSYIDLLARARAALDVVANQTVEDPTLYDEDTEVLFALIVQAVQMYADATDSDPHLVLSDVAENFEGAR